MNYGTKYENSSSGVDITAVYNNETFATLLGVSYQISREKILYSIGTADPSAFVKGKRILAGSLSFIQWDFDIFCKEKTHNCWYLDQIPPFDVVLIEGPNEYGDLVVMKILGVELMNSGQGISVDDIATERNYTYIATGIIPWTLQKEDHTGQIYNEYTDTWTWL